jgi:hypothetical protein
MMLSYITSVLIVVVYLQMSNISALFVAKQYILSVNRLNCLGEEEDVYILTEKLHIQK